MAVHISFHLLLCLVACDLIASGVYKVTKWIPYNDSITVSSIAPHLTENNQYVVSVGRDANLIDEFSNCYSLASSLVNPSCPVLQGLDLIGTTYIHGDIQQVCWTAHGLKLYYSPQHQVQLICSDRNKLKSTNILFKMDILDTSIRRNLFIDESKLSKKNLRCLRINNPSCDALDLLYNMTETAVLVHLLSDSAINGLSITIRSVSPSNVVQLPFPVEDTCYVQITATTHGNSHIVHLSPTFDARMILTDVQHHQIYVLDYFPRVSKSTDHTHIKYKKSLSCDGIILREVRAINDGSCSAICTWTKNCVFFLFKDRRCKLYHISHNPPTLLVGEYKTCYHIISTEKTR